MGGRRNLGEEDGVGKKQKEWAAITGMVDNGEDAILNVSEENPTAVNRGNPLVCCTVAHELSLSLPTVLHLCTASHMSSLIISLSFTLADRRHLRSPDDHQLTEKIPAVLDI